jgi:hypothetical protein
MSKTALQKNMITKIYNSTSKNNITENVLQKTLIFVYSLSVYYRTKYKCYTTSGYPFYGSIPATLDLKLSSFASVKDERAV